MKERLKKYIPEGYDPEGEEAVMLLGILIAIICSLITFIINVHKSMNNIFITEHGVKVIAEGAEMESFSSIMSGTFFLFVIAAAIELMFIVIHYKYYVKDGKAIYLAKRLPDKNYLMKKCIVTPVVRSIMILIVGVICFIIYLFFYIKVGQKYLPHQYFENITHEFIKMIF